MELKTFADIVKLQQEFSSRLADRLQALPGRAAATADEVIAGKRALLEHETAAMDDVRRAKVEVVNRLDGEIERHKQTIVQLEREIIEYDKAKDASGKMEPTQRELDKGKPRKRARPKRPPST
jgi:hypothetical protein